MRHSRLLPVLAAAALLCVGAANAAVSSKGADDLVWVSNSKDGTVTLIDLATLRLPAARSAEARSGAAAASVTTTTFPVGTAPRGIAPLGDGQATVALQGQDQLIVLDPNAGAVLTINVGSRPVDVTVDPRTGNFGWVSLFGANQVQEADEAGGHDTVDVGSKPMGIQFDPRGTQFAVACSGDNSVYLMSRTATATAKTTRIAVGRRPMDVAFNRKGRTLAATNFKDGTVTYIDAKKATVKKTDNVGRGPRGIAYSPVDKTTLAVVLLRERKLLLIKKHSQTKIPVGKKPIDVAFSTDGSLILVTNSGSGTVSVIDTATASVVATITVGAKPWGIAVSPRP